MTKVLSFSFSISPSNEYSRLISFRIDWFYLLAVQGDSQESSPAPQFKSINSLALSFQEIICRSCRRPEFNLVWKVPLEKEMATHSSILAWRIPWTEEPGRLQFMGSKESDMTWCCLSFFFMIQFSDPYTGKNHSFDLMDLCQQSDSSAF